MPQFLAPIINDQQVDANGDPLSGGKIFIYLAGSSTPVTTYSDKAGLTPNTNPLTLNTLGVSSQGAVWLTGGVAYKYVIQNAALVTQRTLDNISGIGDTAVTADQWVTYQAAPTYVSATSFTVAGDQTQIFQIGRRLKTTNTGGTIYSTVSNSVYGAPNTTVTVVNESGVLDAGLSAVSYGVISSLNTSAPFPFPGIRNKLINGNFQVNQRAVSGSVVLAAGAYGHDRWKGGSGGCTYTFALSGNDYLITITAGTLVQVIEGSAIEGGTYVMSWSGTATGKIGAGSLSASGVSSTGVTANANLSVEFSTGTLTRVQLESATITPFERRPIGLELMLCQRYLPCVSAAVANEFIAMGQAVSTTQAQVYVPFTVTSRVAPTSATTTGAFGYANTSGSLSTIGALALSATGSKGAMVLVTGPAALTAGNATHVLSTAVSTSIRFEGCEL